MLKVNSQKDWFERAKKVLPGASFGNFEPSVFIKEGKGSRIWDEDDNEYIDYLIGSGPMLLGHGNEEVLDAVYDQLTRGMTFFTNNSLGVKLAEQISSAVKCAEHIRYSFLSSIDGFHFKLILNYVNVKLTRRRSTGVKKMRTYTRQSQTHKNRRTSSLLDGRMA